MKNKLHSVLIGSSFGFVFAVALSTVTFGSGRGAPSYPMPARHVDMNHPQGMRGSRLMPHPQQMQGAHIPIHPQQMQSMHGTHGMGRPQQPPHMPPQHPPVQHHHQHTHFHMGHDRAVAPGRHEARDPQQRRGGHEDGRRMPMHHDRGRGEGGPAAMGSPGEETGGLCPCCQRCQALTHGKPGGGHAGRPDGHMHREHERGHGGLGGHRSHGEPGGFDRDRFDGGPMDPRHGVIPPPQPPRMGGHQGGPQNGQPRERDGGAMPHEGRPGHQGHHGHGHGEPRHGEPRHAEPQMAPQQHRPHPPHMHGPNGGGFRPVSAEAGTDPLAQRFDRPDFRF